MLCAGCNKPLGTDLHETCHILFDAPKTYQQYVEQAIESYESIMRNYAAPAIAQPPKSEVEVKLELFIKEAK